MERGVSMIERGRGRRGGERGVNDREEEEEKEGWREERETRGAV